MTEQDKEIMQTVCNYYGVNMGLIMEKTRKREICQTRQVGMYFTVLKNFRLTGKYFHKQVGQMYGKRDHATCVHAVKVVNNLIDTDRFFANDIKAISGLLDNDIAPERRLLNKYHEVIGLAINEELITKFLEDWK